ncbi:YqaA family protein [Desulfatiferula olefinivorans]
MIPLPDWIIANDTAYLFTVGFLAATLIPLGSEWLLIALLPHSDSPLFLVAAAGAGNVLGALTTYAVGRYGGEALCERFLGISARDRERAGAFFKTYGSWSLLFSFLPVIGDPLCLIGGLFRVPLPLFFILVFTGKNLRYLLIFLSMRPLI